jgi:hypothetical protein
MGKAQENGNAGHGARPRERGRSDSVGDFVLRLVLISGLAYFALAKNMGPRDHENGKPDRQKPIGNADRQRNDRSFDQVIDKLSAENRADSVNCQRNPPNKFFKDWTFWLAMGTWVLAIVGGVGLHFQDSATEKQLREMQAQQRPWIGTTAHPDGTITTSGQWVDPEILIPVKNFGHSPAFHVGSHTEAIGFDEAAKAYGDIKGPKATLCGIAEAAAVTADKVPDAPDYGFAVFPEIPARIGNRVMTPISYSFPMEQQLAVIGCIAYTDQSHQSGTPIHHTWFCFMTNEPIKSLFVDGAIHLDQRLFTCAFFQGAD